MRFMGLPSEVASTIARVLPALVVIENDGRIFANRGANANGTIRRFVHVSADAPRAAYVCGDGGYLWLTCDVCEEPLTQIEAGDDLDELNAARQAHICGVKP